MHIKNFFTPEDWIIIEGKTLSDVVNSLRSKDDKTG